MTRKVYKFKRTPYDHQREAVIKALKRLKEVGGAALLMEPRTGKTKVAIDIASILHEAGHVSRVLILCPLGVMDVWEAEIEKNCPEKYRVIMWDKRGRKKQALPPWGQSYLDFVVMNPDAWSTPGKAYIGYTTDHEGNKIAVRKRSRTRGGKWEIRRALRKWSPQLIIVDESHRFKSPSAAKTKMLWGFNETPYRLILTGTVQTKKKRVLDVYSQVKFENPESPLVKNLTAGDFKYKYARWTERNGYPQWLRNQNEPMLRRLLHDEAYSVTRKEAFGDLPRLPDQIIPVELTGHSLELYAQMAEDMIARIKTGEITEASIPLVQALRLAQITSGLAKTTPTHTHPEARLLRVGRDKLNTFQDLLSDWAEADEHVIVGARFRGDIQGVVQICKKLKIPCFEMHGGIKGRAARTAMVSGFEQKSGPAVFVMQPRAGGLGIDLRSAAIFIWFSLDRSWVDFTQAEDRNALNPDPRSYIYLLCKGTIDDLLYQSMQEDGEIGRLVMTNPDKLWVPGSGSR